MVGSAAVRLAGTPLASCTFDTRAVSDLGRLLLQQPPRPDLLALIEQAFNSALALNTIFVVISRSTNSLSAPVTTQLGAQLPLHMLHACI